MNESKSNKVDCELVACTEGCGVKLLPSFYVEMWLRHQLELDEIAKRRCCSDDRALAQSVECEQFADFAAGAGQKVDAARTYLQALLFCLEGTYYDHGRIERPSRFLRIRFVSLIDKIEVFCRNDVRLRELVLEDVEVLEARKTICGGCF